jgi:uncharacterized protein (TIGR01777 family)
MSELQDDGATTKRIAVSGSSGLIGGGLVTLLEGEGHRVDRLVRQEPRSGSSDIRWDPAAGQVDVPALEGVDTVVHLAGENIAAGRWTAARKEAIRRSRVNGTKLLCESLASLERRPEVLVAASAIGYYGDRGSERLTEESEAGSGFLPEVCRAWEAATQPADAAGIRVVNLRIGVVLAANGGALARMVPIFKKGVGGKLGNGRQYVSWIAVGDLLDVIRYVLSTGSLSGPVNAVAPNPVTNAELTKALGSLLRRPTIFPVPARVVRLTFGQMGQDLLLASTRVEPAKLVESGFAFSYPNLAGALEAELG